MSCVKGVQKFKFIYLVAIFSFLNWLPVLIVSQVCPSLLVNLFGVILLIYGLISPIVSIIYIVIALWFVIKKKEHYILSSIIIIANAFYLIFGANYVTTYFGRF